MRSALFLERGRPRDRPPHFRCRRSFPFPSKAALGHAALCCGGGPNCFCSDSSIKWRNDDARTEHRRDGRGRSVARTRKDVNENEIFLGLFSIFMGDTRFTRANLPHPLFRLHSSQSSCICTSYLLTAVPYPFWLMCRTARLSWIRFLSAFE